MRSTTWSCHWGRRGAGAEIRSLSDHLGQNDHPRVFLGVIGAHWLASLSTNASKRPLACHCRPATLPPAVRPAAAARCSRVPVECPERPSTDRGARSGAPVPRLPCAEPCGDSHRCSPLAASPRCAGPRSQWRPRPRLSRSLPGSIMAVRCRRGPGGAAGIRALRAARRDPPAVAPAAHAAQQQRRLTTRHFHAPLGPPRLEPPLQARERGPGLRHDVHRVHARGGGGRQAARDLVSQLAPACSRQ